MKKILVILGHPRRPSFCASLADAYVGGAEAAGMEVRRIDVGELRFDPDVRTVSPCEQALEPDLERARALIAWADHLVFVFPAWWGTGPARLKGFLDRVLLPGFAFRVREDGRYEGLLAPRTAHLVTTLDMPVWVYRLFYRAPGLNAFRRSTLGFCGVATHRTVALGPVKGSSSHARAGWLEQARRLGASLRDGTRSPSGKVVAKLLAWLKAIRLQFHPMSWMAYTVGALGAVASGRSWDAAAYWLGYGCVFFAKTATVFSNEWFDYESDRRNRHFGPFTGGSRVLVNGDLRFGELRAGVLFALVAFMACAGLLLERAEGVALPATLAVLAVFGLGYTIPPLRLVWRGWGEVDVAATHSLGVILMGYLTLGAAWNDPFPWLISLPLFFSILPAIILSAIPDYEADKEAGKGTLAVRLGIPRAIGVALGAVAASVVSAWLVRDRPALFGSLRGVLPFILPHAALLCFMLYRERRRRTAGKIDALMVVALSYIVWFGLIPLLRLW